MGRIYNVQVENVAVSAVQDLFEIEGVANKILKIRAIWWSNSTTGATLDAAQMIRTEAKVLPATVTHGSGGTTATPQKTDPGDAAASFTALVNNTTQATTSGTIESHYNDASYLYSGQYYAWNADARPVVNPVSSFIYALPVAPSATIHLNIGVQVEEIG